MLLLLFMAASLTCGCAFASKEVRLKAVPCLKTPSGELNETVFNILVKDARNGNSRSIGSTGWSFRPVVTSDDVADWIGRHVARELINAGGKESKDAENSVICSVKTCDASVGFWSNIKTRLAVNVTVACGEEETSLGELSAERSPFVFLDTSENYEQALADTLKDWLATHAPKIIAALVPPVVEPVEPVVEPVTKPPVEPVPKPPVEPGVEPEKRPVQPPELTLTSPGDKAQLLTAGTHLRGQVQNAAGAILNVELNGKRIRSKKFILSKDSFAYPITLRPGKNSIKVVLTPGKGKPLKRNLIVSFAPPLLTDRWKLVAGGAKLKYLKANPHAKTAMDKVYEILKAGSTPEVRYRILRLEKDFTVAGFQSVLQKTFSAAKKQESVIIFYAGHVFTAGGELALAVPDTLAGKPGTAILLSDIAFDADRYFKGKNVLLVARNSEGKILEKIPDLGGAGAALSVFVFNPAKGSETEIAGALEGKADSDYDGYVSLRELDSFLKKKGKTAFHGTIEPGFRVSRVKVAER
jgi:hypothetical protein